jgi:2'-5' RNA ligase
LNLPATPPSSLPASEESLQSLPSPSSPLTDPVNISQPNPTPTPVSRPRPNFFLGIRLTNPIFQELVTQFQQNILLKSPHLKKCLTPVQKLHLTCFVFSLQSPNDILLAQNCFLSCQEKILSMISKYLSLQDLSLTFDSLSRFGSNVLFIAPQQNEILQIFREMNYFLADEFQKVGIFTDPKEMARVNQWNPHLTVAKTSADRRNKSKARVGIKKEDYENCTEMFASGATVQVPVEQIDLLSMAEQSEDGYYKSYGTIYLNN